MFKQFQHIWKNATVNKYQIVLRRFASSTVDHVTAKQQFEQSNKNYNQRRQHISAFHSCENAGQIRYISNNTVNNSTNLSRSENVTSKYKKMEANLKWRSDPVITTLETPQFKLILRKNILDLVALFQKHNYEIRIAGGAVRDLLMNITPTDIDFATTATPKQMVEMFTNENIRMINSNGEKHGTVTPRINDEENFEVTTLRIDVRTDGRHAEVEFTTDWLLDANRRDLTINSMFLGFDGKVYDYFFGYEDLKNRRVVFVGEPANRIQEDYLRILRYFRFYGKISSNPNNFDAKTIEAICENIDGLQKISGERIWTELKKILQGNHRLELFAKLIECGAGRYIGFPASIDCTDLFRLKQTLQTTFKDVPINSTTILSTVLNSKEDALCLHSRLKLSAYERDMAFFLAENKAATRDIDDLLHYQKMCLPQRNRSFKLLKDFVLELLKYNGKRQIYDQLLDWEMPKFPVNGTILIESGYSGRKMGAILEKLRDIWADSNFQMSQEELMQQHLTPVQQKVAEEESLRKKVKTKK
ncbi:CCA tRNA nucleotidyltransferase 1, mitochondrial [Sitodiplosis mosellana]|uniref:CCA tRNA nucleotidyltransferase 1, mitochondrial n=1 Tax=Sitodiplosis mosellana TaxID=263140 RepID=UPI002444A8DA|nr:CCA tRNA nucleotidyltransferase 1, mitochondrial [Sitodiplosis mosellana]